MLRRNYPVPGRKSIQLLIQNSIQNSIISTANVLCAPVQARNVTDHIWKKNGQLPLPVAQVHMHGTDNSLKYGKHFCYILYINTNRWLGRNDSQTVNSISVTLFIIGNDDAD